MINCYLSKMPLVKLLTPLAVVLASWQAENVEAFAPQSAVTMQTNFPLASLDNHHQPTPLHMAATGKESDDSDDEGGKKESPFQLRRRLKKHVLHNPILWSAATMVAGAATPLGGAVLRTKPAMASAPVMALPKAEDRDPGTDAMQEYERQMRTETQQELDEMAQKAREIEKTQGPGARMKFEKDFKQKQEQRAKQKAEDFVKLKQNLLEQGIDPWCDLEGQRQVILHERGVDLAEVDGTPFALEKMMQEKRPRESQKFQKAPHRDMIKLMVQDMKNRGTDYLEYFENHKDQTMTMLEMQTPQAIAMVQTYKANMEEYGQITKPRPGEMSMKEKQAVLAADPKAQKELEKQRKAGEQAKLKAEKARLKAEAKAEKERAKAEAKAAKEEAKRAKLEKKEEEKQARIASAAAAAAATVAGASAASAGAAIESTVSAAPTLPDSVPEIPSPAEITAESEATGETSLFPEAPSSSSSSSDVSTATPGVLSKFKAPIAVVGIGAGAYGLKMYRDKQALEEEERQRQFKLMMEGDGTAPAPSPSFSDSDDMDIDSLGVPDEIITPVKESPVPTPVPAPVEQPAPSPAPAAKKRRFGIFKSKGDGRETDLSQLIQPDAQAPEFARLLGKVLTFGAPGRFPAAMQTLGNDLPMEEFDLLKAQELLISSRVSAGLEVSQSAEIFANVVNCMLIDIVDLASSSLKEKESKKTVDAINIVVDFMNHAASLYDSVAEGATITPVTYSGKLAKSKLEQMYSQYAVGGMLNMAEMTDDFDSRVQLLRDVFAISEKKAEGLMMKAMQKNMMEMMKSGEGMDDMMKNMGMDPSMMAGLMGGGPEGEMDPEQLKTMLRELKAAKDSGDISKEELDSVRAVFKESFGASIDELMQQSEGATGEDREVLDLIKSVLED